MPIDYAEKEREFLASLEADTGRDLAGWMRAIDASNLSERNEIIDWLRQQGFLFAKASWLERIHHNGGRPIYIEAAASALHDGNVKPAQNRVAPKRAAPSPDAPSLEAQSQTQTQPNVTPVPLAPERSVTPKPRSEPRPPDVPPSLDRHSALNAILTEAKAYRPLAHYLLRELEKAIPGLHLEPKTNFIALSVRDEFAALAISARELRLGVAFRGSAAPEPFVKARFHRTHPDVPASMTHMIVLTDARQITPALLRALADAAASAI
jgi:hypothetical protein